MLTFDSTDSSGWVLRRSSGTSGASSTGSGPIHRLRRMIWPATDDCESCTENWGVP